VKVATAQGVGSYQPILKLTPIMPEMLLLDFFPPMSRPIERNCAYLAIRPIQIINFPTGIMGLAIPD
tara:strand:+ start:186 stop:386 length:201 start_codon:yes stop_codon:yes gene_type:complete